uniref:HECT domain-containing protein n=1 Tax=Acanthochromis polyacanthus TaxID=80966 RepID=A0A3Q1EPA1_9TELE
MRLVPMPDQLRKGLMLCDLMNSHQDLCQKLFIPGEDVEVYFILDCFLFKNTRPVYSEIGSAKHQKEVHIMNFLQDYLQEIEDSGIVTPEGLTVGRIMQWMTGQRHKPVQPSEKKEFLINIQFQHDCDTQHTVCFPTVSACSRTVTFPSAHLRTYSEFKNILTLAVSHGQTFDRV